MESKKIMSSAQFSEYVLDVHDLYLLALRNGFYLPSESANAVNEVMLLGVTQGLYWCPKYDEIRIKPCPKPPTKDVLLNKVLEAASLLSYNVSWIDEKHHPDKKWLVDVLATLKPGDEIFKKDYVPPPVRKRLKDIETIVLPGHLFEGLPPSKSKAKARRLKVVSEAFLNEKMSRMKELRKQLDHQILDHAVKADEYKEKLKAKQAGARSLEEEKKQSQAA